MQTCVHFSFSNRSLRLVAYRQFSWFAHGFLGKGRRRVIPSCVVHEIQRQYPEADEGAYHGFEEAGNDNEEVRWPG